MMQLLQMLVIAKLLQCSIISCSYAENPGGTPTIFYITPKPHILCPGTPCFTLFQYSQDQDTYISTDTELRFLPGVHRLNSRLVIEGGTNITTLALVREIQDQSEVVVTIEGQASLKLIGIESIRIESLHFSGINILAVENSSSLTVSDLQLTGSAFSFKNIGNITGTNITITNLSTAHSAGVIRQNGGVLFNVIIKNNSGNSILIIDESFVKFKGHNTFINNSANKGSTLLIKTSTIMFDGFILFQSNKCNNKGGAMNIINSDVTFIGNIELSDNTAKDGGAIQLDHSVLKLKGLVDVSNNWVTKRVLVGKAFGGAINSIQSDIIMTDIVTFRGNHVYAKLLMGLGGAISAQKSTLTLSGIISFHHNHAGGFVNFGGAILLSNSTLIATNVFLTFTNNRAQNGGAIAITGLLMFTNPLPSKIIVEGTSLFDANVAISGGVLYGDHFMYILFIGNTTLSRYRGQKPSSSQIIIAQAAMAVVQFNGHTEVKHSFSVGAIFILLGNVRALFRGITKFINNTGLSGVLEVANSSSIKFFGQIYFQGNHGGTKGMIALAYSTPTNPSLISGETTFIDNDSGISLAYSEIKLEGDFNFTRNGGPHIGCISTIGSMLVFNGTMLMNFNTAENGPAIYSYNSSVKMYGDYNFSKHTVVGDGGAIFALRSILYLDGSFSFISNSASNKGGAIWATNSELFLSGYHVYMNNSANAGGVIFIGLFAIIHFNNLAVIYENNRAKKGAIFYHDDILNAVDCLDDASLPAPIEPLLIRTDCFFDTSDNVNVTHVSNIASDGGNILFGGNLKRCNQKLAAETFIHLFHTDDSIQNITSSPYQIVFCKNDKPVIISSIRSSNMIITTIPGRLFSVSVAGLNQLFKPIVSTVRAEISAESNSTARLGSFQSKQLANNSCSKLSYRVFTEAPSINVILYAEGPCNKLGTAAKTIQIDLGPCPDGFELVRNECICEADLLRYTMTCNIDDESIQNSGNFWAGGLYDNNGSYMGIISFPNCPFDYCTKETVNFTLMDPDKQCAHNRSGTICGQCIVNYSLTLGDVRCSECSKINPAITFGLLLLFGLVGTLLVILITLLKMTVASGTLNGLIFYANIVDANRDILVPQAGLVRVFISWLNLDFGFSTCFYRGMDMYAYTWLQFLFPFYIWMLIGVLIVISRRSAWVTKRVGSNPVAVLATLILLSYAKLLRTMITVFYFGTLQLPHGQTSTVWLYDGNILYLHGKHLALFIFALLFFVMIFLPYNSLLVVEPWLQNISGKRVNEPEPRALIRKVLVGWYEDYRLRTFLDTYTVAYNPGYQYWTGVFLMLRCMLFIVFVTSAFRNSSATLMAVTTSLLVVAFLTRAFTGRIYKNWYMDILEGLFLLNLGILSVATSHNLMTGGNQQLVANISGGISLALFLLIVAYHAFKQVASADVYRMINMKLKRKFWPMRDENDQQAQLLAPLTNEQELAPMTTIISLPSEET